MICFANSIIIKKSKYIYVFQGNMITSLSKLTFHLSFSSFLNKIEIFPSLIMLEFKFISFFLQLLLDLLPSHKALAMTKVGREEITLGLYRTLVNFLLEGDVVLLLFVLFAAFH